MPGRYTAPCSGWSFWSCVFVTTHAEAAPHGVPTRIPHADGGVTRTPPIANVEGRGFASCVDAGGPLTTEYATLCANRVLLPLHRASTRRSSASEP